MFLSVTASWPTVHGDWQWLHGSHDPRRASFNEISTEVNGIYINKRDWKKCVCQFYVYAPDDDEMTDVDQGRRLYRWIQNLLKLKGIL